MLGGGGYKKAKRPKKCIIKQRIKFDNETCLKNNKIISRLQQRLISEAHNVFTEEVNKIALMVNDDERLESFNTLTAEGFSETGPFMCLSNHAFWVFFPKCAKFNVDSKNEK